MNLPLLHLNVRHTERNLSSSLDGSIIIQRYKQNSGSIIIQATKAELCAVYLINPNVIITDNREGNARQNKMSPLTGLSTCREQSLDTAAMLQAMPGRNGFGNNMLDT